MRCRVIDRADAVLIDGDHNWHTVYNELKIVDEFQVWPITLLHDIDWPYGRRDVYYDPSTVPAEYRQPHVKAGLVRGKSARYGRFQPESQACRSRRGR